ncbi:MAG: ABC transporter ATP-binding protein, partial [Ferruginibacter sp.]|nr:ABC transporter ATP-binding protein [Ferruginibacter sp.]
DALTQMPGNARVIVNEKTVQLFFPSGTADLAAVNQFCFNKGIVLSQLQLKKKSLESKFFELTS